MDVIDVIDVRMELCLARIQRCAKDVADEAKRRPIRTTLCCVAFSLVLVLVLGNTTNSGSLVWGSSESAGRSPSLRAQSTPKPVPVHEGSRASRSAPAAAAPMQPTKVAGDNALPRQGSEEEEAAARAAAKWAEEASARAAAQQAAESASQVAPPGPIEEAQPSPQLQEAAVDPAAPAQEAGRQKAEYGCWAVTTRDECCLYIDGRTDEWGGQPCVPAVPDTTFSTGNVCESQNWVAVHGDGRAGSCGVPVPPTEVQQPSVEAPAAQDTAADPAPQAERQRAEHGCWAVTSRDECCLYFDGRADEWGGHPCVPAAADMTFTTGNICETQNWVDLHGEGRSGVCPVTAQQAIPAEPLNADEPDDAAPQAERQRAEHGCWAVASRDECCLYIDGRSDEWGGHPCVPAALDMTFTTGNVCETQSWVDLHGEGRAGVCSVPAKQAVDEPSASSAEVPRQKAEDGCWTITSREECCLYIDGRSDEWGGHPCVPAVADATFTTGNVCETQSWVDAHGEGRAGTCSAIAKQSSAGSTVDAEVSQEESVAPVQPATRQKALDGCWSIAQRDICCLHIDGRTDEWGGQPCVPAAADMEFSTGNVCETKNWADAHGEGRAGVCPQTWVEATPAEPVAADAPEEPGEDQAEPEPKAERQRAEHGCWAVTARDECCLYIDGRSDEWGGHPCVPAAADMTFTTGNVCETQNWVDVNGEGRAGTCNEEGEAGRSDVAVDVALEADAVPAAVSTDDAAQAEDGASNQRL